MRITTRMSKSNSLHFIPRESTRTHSTIKRSLRQANNLETPEPGTLQEHDYYIIKQQI